MYREQARLPATTQCTLLLEDSGCCCSAVLLRLCAERRKCWKRNFVERREEKNGPLPEVLR